MHQPRPDAFRLSHILRAHSSDAKCVFAAYDTLSESELVLSASRDETAACWSRPYTEQPSGSRHFLRGPTYHGQRFANSVAYVQPSPVMPRGQILLGSLDSQIRCFDPLRSDKPVQTLSEHWDNVSVISVAPQAVEGRSSNHAPCFISGSWDKTARVWSYSGTASASSEWHTIHVLRTHEQAVWGVAIVDPPNEERTGHLQGGRYLTASADLFVRLFHGDQLFAVYAGHSDVVRSIVLLPQLQQTPESTEQQPPLFPAEHLFATASNDGTVRVWSLDPRRSPTSGNGGDPVRKLQGHTSLVYDLAVLLSDSEATPSRLVSSGEDGTVRIWDWTAGKLETTLPQPAISVWSVDVLPRSHDIVAALSDGTVRVYTQSSGKAEDVTVSGEAGSAASAKELQEHEDLVKSVAARLEEGRTSGSTQQAAKDEHQGKELFESQWYDAVLRIDVSDDMEPLPLPINNGDDRKVVAEAFIQKHGLPTSYLAEIVNFINMVFPSPRPSSSSEARPTLKTDDEVGRSVPAISSDSDKADAKDRSDARNDGDGAVQADQNVYGGLTDDASLERFGLPVGSWANLWRFHQSHFEDGQQRAALASEAQHGWMPAGLDLASFGDACAMQERREVFRKLQSGAAARVGSDPSGFISAMSQGDVDALLPDGTDVQQQTKPRDGATEA
ncbi:hypothetical protein ACQY0O_003717 [Thecaphora frezii]